MAQHFPVGTFCVIQGLQSEAGRHLNGCVGEVKSFDTRSGRLCVRLNQDDPPSRYKKLKLDNLQPQCFLPEFLNSEKIIFETGDPGTFLVRNTIQAEKDTFLTYGASDLKTGIPFAEFYGIRLYKANSAMDG